MWRRGLRHGCQAVERSLQLQACGSNSFGHSDRWLHVGSSSIRETSLGPGPKELGNFSPRAWRPARSTPVRRFASAQPTPHSVSQAKASAAASSPAAGSTASAANAAKPSTSGAPVWLIAGVLVAAGLGVAAFYAPEAPAGVQTEPGLGRGARPTELPAESNQPDYPATENTHQNASAPGDQGPCIDATVGPETVTAGSGQPAHGDAAQPDAATDAKARHSAAKEEAAAAVAAAMENAAALATAEAGAAAAEAEVALEQYMGAKSPGPAHQESLDAPYLIARARMSRHGGAGAGASALPGPGSQGVGAAADHTNSSAPSRGDGSVEPAGPSGATSLGPTGYNEASSAISTPSGGPASPILQIELSGEDQTAGIGQPQQQAAVMGGGDTVEGGSAALWGGRPPAEVLVEAIQEAERRQAEADALLLAERLQASEERHAGELAAVRRDAAASAQQVSALQKKISDQAAAHSVELDALQKTLLSDKDKALKMQEERLRHESEAAALQAQLAAAEHLQTERLARVKELDELRMLTSSLHLAFRKRSQEHRRSHQGHKLCLGALALERSLETGQPLAQQIDLLARPHPSSSSSPPAQQHQDGAAATAMAGGEGRGPWETEQELAEDVIVGAVLRSLPPEVVTGGARTRLQLAQEFAQLKGVIQKLAYVPAGRQAGLLSHVVASLAVMLKVPDASDGIGKVLAEVERNITYGDLCRSADVLEQALEGTAAAEAVKAWTRAARVGAAAEQAVTLLRAHITTISASLI